jgi:hypothetical protein
MGSDHHEEKPFTKFDHYRQRGDDFLKIELFVNSKKSYLHALELHPDDDYVLAQLKVVTQMLKTERHRIYVILAVFAAIALLAVLIF